MTASTIPVGAHHLGAFRISDDRQTGEFWVAVMERVGPAAVRTLVAEAHRRGHLTAGGSGLLASDDDVAVLDFLDDAEDIVGDATIPTVEAWEWWVRAAGLRLESVDGGGSW